MTSPGRLAVTFPETGGPTVPEIEREWRALESAAGAAPYLCWDWLAAWRAVYEPSDTVFVRIAPVAGGPPVALGLLERRAAGRWWFAGAPISPARGLVACAGDRARAWVALSLALEARAGDWRSLGVEGAHAEAIVLPGARLEPSPVWVADLPGDFDAFLRARTANQRKAHKQKLTRLAKAGGEVALVAPDDHGAALAAFVALHRRRATAKGERHPQIDGRLGATLAALGASSAVRLRLFALRVDGATVGVSVRLDREELGTAWFYNAGIDPAHGRLGPGIVLELHSIRDAIERGFQRFDLGPGWWRYKEDLGGVEVPAFDGRAVSPTAGAAAQRLAGATLAALYARAPGRGVLARIRRAATSSGPSTAG